MTLCFNCILFPSHKHSTIQIPPRTFTSPSKEGRISKAKFAVSSTYILKCFHLAPIPICVFLCKQLQIEALMC